MKTSFDYHTEEFTFEFLMPLNGKTARIKAYANLDEITVRERVWHTEDTRPVYIDVYKAFIDGKYTEFKFEEIISQSDKDSNETLRLISEKLTERLITNVAKNWVATDAPRIFRDQWEDAYHEKWFEN